MEHTFIARMQDSSFYKLDLLLVNQALNYYLLGLKSSLAKLISPLLLDCNAAYAPIQIK